MLKAAFTGVSAKYFVFALVCNITALSDWFKKTTTTTTATTKIAPLVSQQEIKPKQNVIRSCTLFSHFSDQLVFAFLYSERPR